MLKSLLKIGLGFVVFVSLAGGAQATRIVSSSVPFFPDGMTLDAGTVYHGSTLILVFSGSDPIEQQLPANDVTSAGVHFEYDSDVAGQFVVSPENMLGVVVIKNGGFGEIDLTTLSGLSWETGPVTVSTQDLVIFRLSDNTYMKLGNTTLSNSSVEFDYQQLRSTSGAVPEPGTIGLLGTGIIGLCAMLKMRRRR